MMIFVKETKDLLEKDIEKLFYVKNISIDKVKDTT
jgi:hypothetical protein